MAEVEKVTGTFLLLTIKGMENRITRTKGKKQRDGAALITDEDIYEVRPRKRRDGLDLVSDRFRNGPIWYAGPDAVRNAIAYAKYSSFSRSHRAAIRVLDDSGAVIELLIQGRSIR